MRIRLDPEKVRWGLAVRGLTKAEVSRLTGLSQVTLTNLIAGGRVNMPTVLKLAHALNARPVVPELQELLPDQEERDRRL